MDGNRSISAVHPKGRPASLRTAFATPQKESLERDYMRRWGLNSTVKRRPPRGITTDQRRGVYIVTAAMIVFVAAVVVKWLS
jgi:hypothetical protein